MGLRMGLMINDSLTLHHLRLPLMICQCNLRWLLGQMSKRNHPMKLMRVFGANQQLDLVDADPADKKSGTASKKTRRDSLTAIQLARTTVQTQLVI